MLLILAFILLLVLPSSWGPLVAAGVAVLGIGEVYYWYRTVRDRRVTVGVQTLIGETAEVVTPCHPLGQVRVEGELWGARCAAGADSGTRVRVVDVDRLTLVVEPADESS
jgi:membrane protein implicated in regulation of membrane protease activity